MKKKKGSGSSRPEKRLPASAIFTTRLSNRERQQLEQIVKMPDTQIDLSDAPESLPQAAEVRVGRFYRPIKQLISLRIDADVWAWFRLHGPKYQTHMNQVLRREMESHPRGR